MLNKAEIEGLIKWKIKVGTAYVDLMEDFIHPIVENLGDDATEVIQYLQGLNEEEAFCLSGCFEFIYEKFNTDEMYDALEKIETKFV